MIDLNPERLTADYADKSGLVVAVVVPTTEFKRKCLASTSTIRIRPRNPRLDFFSFLLAAGED